MQLSSEMLLPGVSPDLVTWSSSNPDIAIVDQNGAVTPKDHGSVIITAAAADGSGRSAQCEIIIGYEITYKLNGGKNDSANPAFFYKTCVSLNSPSRAGCLFKGWYTDRRFTKKISGISGDTDRDLTLYAKWKKIRLSRGGIKGLKSNSPKKMTVKVKKVKGAGRYELSYGTDKNFGKGSQTVTVKKTSVTVKHLAKGKTYYVKVRAYRRDSAGKKVYGKESAVKKVKIAK